MSPSIELLSKVEQPQKQEQEPKKILGFNVPDNIVNVTGWVTQRKSSEGLDLGPFLDSLRPVDVALIEKALPQLKSTTHDYINAPLKNAFNWDTMAAHLGPEWEGEWFIVAFRSVRKATADSELLFNADVESQKEAVESGGFLKYWYADLNQHKECLAMCLWVSLDYAIKATRKPLHIKAAKLTSQMYESYKLERHRLVKKAGETVFHVEAM
ncbi:hypothetical protein BDF14DRAFT_1798628 [Spinellus fusiger]|nr:hypothetical protein BDF14DRAFT_1798628 [Spinellus fusiger]